MYQLTVSAIGSFLKRHPGQSPTRATAEPDGHGGQGFSGRPGRIGLLNVGLHIETMHGSSPKPILLMGGLSCDRTGEKLRGECQ